MRDESSWKVLAVVLLTAMPLGLACGRDSDPKAESAPEPPAAAVASGAASEEAGRVPVPPASAAPAPRVREIDGAEMAFVGAGEFAMGSDETPFRQERPLHVVDLDGYWIDRFEVTNAAYRNCVEAGGCVPVASLDNPELNGDSLPVLVPWEAATAYCAWAGGRLPTEAEWEKAARGTDGRLWPWGPEFEEGRANLSGEEDGFKLTAPVGSFPAGVSPYGLEDMAGNAAEWTGDRYDGEYYESSPNRNPQGAASGEDRVYRSVIANGGGGPEKCRTVARYPGRVDWDYGFRCAQDEVPAS